MTLSYFIANKRLWLPGQYLTKIGSGFLRPSTIYKRYSNLSQSEKERFIQTYLWEMLQELDNDQSIVTSWRKIDIDAVECKMEKDFFSMTLSSFVNIKVKLVIVFYPNQILIALEEITF